MNVLTTIYLSGKYTSLHYQQQSVKGTPLRSDRVINTLKKNIFKNLVFLFSTCVWHRSISCGTLICFVSVGNSFKTCIISVDLGKAFKRLSLFHRYIPIKPSCHIDKRHIMVPQNKFQYT